MYEYISGVLKETTPASAVVDCGGIGYDLRITLNTYSKISSQANVLLYTHLIVREDAHLIYGFYTKEERSLFRLLISVSGIGANTAGVMLSSMSPDEVIGAIQTENVNAIKSVKGIGIKTAQRVIIELKDKVSGNVISGDALFKANHEKEEALSALTMLGFVKSQASKVLDKVIASNENLTVEEMIKRALKLL